jgi:lipoate-protein ligase A
MSPSRGILRTTHSFSSLITSQKPTQIYLSLSLSPHLNLSLEHHLFQTLPSTTRTLLLYINTPSLILGRNQNPWVETHHPLLLRSPQIQLLRRRSGGGTVFHDEGNVNYSVTVPTGEFNRDTHALLIVRALRKLGVLGAAVNKRHDIVVFPTPVAEEKVVDDPEGSRKVSGSAYKLTRLRSYHHGTMLLSTNLDRVRELLRSPAKQLIEARGVASVPSPVTNIGVGSGEFIAAVVEEFKSLYGDAGVAEVTEQEAGEVENVQKGMRELKSAEWIYGQTPRFSIALPGTKVVADKGVVEEITGVDGEGLVGRRFGGDVVERVLVRGGMEEEEARRWAQEMVGGREWATQ